MLMSVSMCLMMDYIVLLYLNRFRYILPTQSFYCPSRLPMGNFHLRVNLRCSWVTMYPKRDRKCRLCLNNRLENFRPIQPFLFLSILRYAPVVTWVRWLRMWVSTYRTDSCKLLLSWWIILYLRHHPIQSGLFRTRLQRDVHGQTARLLLMLVSRFPERNNLL